MARLIAVWYAVLLGLCLSGMAQEARPKLPNNLAYLRSVNRVPQKNVCRSGEYENPATHDPYWKSEGVTIFSDGSEETHSLYMGLFRTAKERKKQRRKALTECANWLDAQER